MGSEFNRRSFFKASATAVGSGGVAAAALTSSPGTAQAAPATPAKPFVPLQLKNGVASGFVIGAPTVSDRENHAVVGVPMLCEGGPRLAVTQPVRPSAAEEIAAGLSAGMLVDFVVKQGEVVVGDEQRDPFHVVLTKSGTPIFTTQKYGPELAPRNGGPGQMVAAGWVYNKAAGAITIGDGRVVTEDISGRPLPQPVKRYEETYQVASDVEVYSVDTINWGASGSSSFDAIPVTKDYSYSTTQRHAAFVVFDRDHRKVKQAKVRQIFFFTPHDESDGKPVWDVPTQSDLLSTKGVDPVSGKRYVDIVATRPTTAAYTRSTEPFEIVPGTFFFVGDNEVSCYLFKTNMGTRNPQDDRLVLLDTGWPNSGYQYWKNIEAMGFDPRDIDDIIMAHGHLDHYGATVELVTMIENSGGKVRLLSPREDIAGLPSDAAGNVWNLPPALPASETLIRQRSEPFTYDEWMDFGNVRMLPLWSPGHTPGSTSFIFEVENPEDGERLIFGYMGGYGWSPKIVSPTNGWQRLGFAYNLAWLQQRFEPDYVTGQHANQFPIIEIYQALKAYNNDPANSGRQLSMLKAMNRGEWVNYLEKRYAVATNAVADDQPGYQSIETFGPFKPGRENGVADVRVRLVDGGKVLHGYDRALNKNPQIPLLENGATILIDSFVHDPDGWYVQFELDVLDSYGGYLPGVGPVESIRPEVTEILRTQRFSSREEAELITKSVEAGSTYRVTLTPASAIVIPDGGAPVFREG
ncbi:MBL fold metallo-hydrolase [Pseudarthrobacter sp. NPDC058329]|uniref:MBL fold metallo-hydrolase n=1 Tax=Pseudarthrobacter sp. NPDC058329 TaxID=3346448 RepID=UPI0036DFA207